MKLRSIEIEREDKLRSLFTDRISVETGLLDEALAQLKLTSAQLKQLSAAREFTLRQDYGPRDLDKYYGVHPIRTARFLASWARTRSLAHGFEVVVAALIHNAIEKHVLDEAELEKRYGAWVRSAIVTLTPDRKLMTTDEGRSRYYAGLAAHGTETEVLKFFDKFDNLFVICVNPDADMRTSYIDEIEHYVRPIAVRHCPDLVSYLDELIADMRRIGYYRPTVF